MSKTSFVLQALKILVPEEMLKLSEVLHEKQVPLKMAAGEELVAWSDEVQKRPQKRASDQDAKILSFPKRTIKEMPSILEEEGKPHPSSSNMEDLLNSDIVLWQREMTKQTEAQILKLEAFKGYERFSEMYVVKDSQIDSKEKIRFAATNGVLINKKQA